MTVEEAPKPKPESAPNPYERPWYAELSYSLPPRIVTEGEVRDGPVQLFRDGTGIVASVRISDAEGVVQALGMAAGRAQGAITRALSEIGMDLPVPRPWRHSVTDVARMHHHLLQGPGA